MKFGSSRVIGQKKEETTMGRPMVLLSAKEIEKMRVAGRFAAELLDHLGSMLKPGITTQALNDEA